MEPVFQMSFFVPKLCRFTHNRAFDYEHYAIADITVPLINKKPLYPNKDVQKEDLIVCAVDKALLRGFSWARKSQQQQSKG